MEVLPPFAICKPAGRQGGGENLAGGAWRGWRSAGVLGENFYSLFLLSHKKSVFNHL